jgi:WD40 repeat protein
MNENWISAAVSGGAVGVAGAQVVRIENLYVGSAGNTGPAKPAGPIPPCPYPGLAYFGPQDASRFFGRDKAIEALIAAVAKRSFTALVGASGSGKSSVVLAGLAPRLIPLGGWRSTYFRIGTEPDKNPFAALARALEPLTGERGLTDKLKEVQRLAEELAAGSITLTNIIGHCRAANPGKRILLIADQFEETFTFVTDDALRKRFIDTLINAFPDPDPGVTLDVSLILTLRADFYNAALRHRPLADKLQDRVENLGPMIRDELRQAIINPAERLEPSVTFEPGLAGTILDDVERRPGSLPLLQFALREMWGRLKTPLMTRVDYDAIGGVEGALAKRAQTIFEDATNKETDAASVTLFRQLFTRLVTLGEGAEDTRRIVTREELGQQEWALAQKLADEDNRLVVTAATTPEQETVEVAHEALIRNWPALVQWVNRDRAFISWRGQLKQRIEDWRKVTTDEGTLLRGGPLAVAEDWLAKRGNDLNQEEKAFVVASVALRDVEKLRAEEDLQARQAQLKEVADAQEKTAHAQQETEAAQEKTTRAQQWARRALGATAVVIIVAAGLFYWQYNTNTHKLKAGQDQLAEARTTLDARQQQLVEAKATLNARQQQLVEAQSALHGEQAQLAEANSALTASREDLRRQQIAAVELHANLLDDLADAELARGNLDRSLRLAAKSAIESLALQKETIAASSARATLAADLSQSHWRVIFTGEDKMYAASFSPDGTRVVIASADKAARIWDIATGTVIAVLRGHSAAFSGDGLRVVTASDDNTARVWDAATGKELVVLQGHRNGVTSAAFSPDGSRIVTASGDDTARIWTLADKKFAVLPHDINVMSASFSRDGSRIVTATLGRTVNIWDAATAKRIAVLPHEEPLTSAAFSPDGSRVVSASTNGQVRIWDVKTAKQVAELKGHELAVNSVAFSPDGRLVVTASEDMTARIWDASTAKEVAVFRGHEQLLTSAAFSADGLRVITSSWDRTARIWNVELGVKILTTSDQGKVHSATFSPDGTRIVTGDKEIARIWDAASAKVISVLAGHDESITSVAYSPDGSRVATGSSDLTARIWDIENAKEVAVLRGHEQILRSVAWSPDGERIVTASEDKTARVWDVKTATEIVVLRGHEGAVWSAAFSPDGSRVVTASADKTARIWDAASGQNLVVLQGHERDLGSAAFSPDGSRIVTGSADHTARIWNSRDGSEIAVLRGHDAAVIATAFSSDGSRIITGSYDKTARIWDTETTRQIALLRGHQDRINSAALSLDGSRIVTASNDKTARIWDVHFATMPVKGLLDEVCRHRLVGLSTMTRDEMRLAGYPDSEAQIDVCAGVAEAGP